MTNLIIKNHPILKYQQGTSKDGIQLQYQGPSYYEVQEQMKKDDPNAYNRLQIQNSRTLHPHSEVINYVDANGDYKTNVNIGSGFVSGTDPIAEQYVLGNIFGKPLQYIGKGLKSLFAKPKLPKAVNLTTNTTTSQNVVDDALNLERSSVHPLTAFEGRVRARYGNTTDDLLKKVRNPKVVKTKQDQLDIAKEFYRNVYKDKQFSEEQLEQIAKQYLEKYPQAFEHYFRTTYQPNPNIITTGGLQGQLRGITPSESQVSKISNFFRTPQNWWDAITHEGAHLFRWNIPTKVPKPEGFDFSKLHPKVQQYFIQGATKDNPIYDELLARGTQIKNWLGIKDNTPITGEQLKALAKGAYQKSGAIDNNMDDFFLGITDYDKFAKWLSTYALGTTPLIMNYD